MQRTFELSTHMKAISRAEGRSATSAAAYRACCVIECDREGRIHDYSRKAGLEASEIILPEGAPAWARDRAKLWNAAEFRETNKDKRAKSFYKADAQTARDAMFSFPAELSAAGRINVARIVARRQVDIHGIAVDFAIHEPGKDGDERNYHCHMLFSTRRMTAKGFGEKAREWDDLKNAPKLAKEHRAFVAKTINDELRAEGKADIVFVEHRSFKARGSAQVPTRHQGPGKTNARRKDRGRARQAWTATQRRAQKERHDKELASLKLRQDFALQGKLAALSQRGREGASAIRRELQEQRRADTAATGLRRILLKITGREGRDAFDRQARDAQRIAAANEKIKALKTEIRAERGAYVNDQMKDRAALIERHGIEDRQLTQTAASRAFADRAAERADRQPRVQTPARERDQQRGEQDRGRSLDPS